MAEAGTNIPTNVGGEPGDLEAAEEVFTDQRAFMYSICPNFLSHVTYIEDMMDHLKAKGAVDSEDEEEVRAQPSRKGKARKCWIILSQVSPQKFASVCVPALEHFCHLVVQGKVFRFDPCSRVDKCLHHAVKEMVPLKKFADIFPEIKGCLPEEYKRMLDGPNHWELAFSLCRRNNGSADVIRKTLNKFGVPLPEDLRAVLASGIPCSCPERGDKRYAENRQTLDVYKWRPISDTCPGSSRGSLNNTYANYGERKGERPRSEMGEEKFCFESPELEDSVMGQVELLNLKMREVIRIKGLFHEVAGLHMELLVLQHPTRNNRMETNDMVVLRDKAKVLRQELYIVRLRHSLKDYEETSIFLKKMAPLRLDVEIPDKFKNILTDRKEELAREFNDAEVLYNKFRDIFKQLGLDRLDSVEKARAEEGHGCESRAVSAGESFCHPTGNASLVESVNDESGRGTSQVEVLAFTEGGSAHGRVQQDQATVFNDHSDLADGETDNSDDNFETDYNGDNMETNNDDDNVNVFYESDIEMGRSWKPYGEGEHSHSDYELPEEDGDISSWSFNF